MFTSEYTDTRKRKKSSVSPTKPKAKRKRVADNSTELSVADAINLSVNSEVVPMDVAPDNNAPIVLAPNSSSEDSASQHKTAKGIEESASGSGGSSESTGDGKGLEMQFVPM